MARFLCSAWRLFAVVCLVVVSMFSASLWAQSPGPLARPLFLRGGFNGWQSPPEAGFVFDGKVYRAFLKLGAGDYEFKVADAEWKDGTNLGAAADGTAPLSAGGSLSLSGKANALLKVIEPGVYEFLLDPAAPPTLRVQKASPADADSYLQRFRVATDLMAQLKLAKAYWVAPDAVAWQVEASAAASPAVWLVAAPTGEIKESAGRLTGAVQVLLQRDGAVSDPRTPQLKGMPRFRIPKMTPKMALEFLKGPMALVAQTGDGKTLEATSLQSAAVIDELAAYSGSDLGARVVGTSTEFRLWAPTARSVKVKVFATAEATVPETELPLAARPRGVWFGRLNSKGVGKYYLYEVAVYSRSTGKVETNLVTDPYSLSLAANSRRSQIVEMNSADLLPEGWSRLAKPPLPAFEDAVLYELHVRDFSLSDERVRSEARGKFAAFSEKESFGMRHLRSLAQAGVNHVHLLPVFDLASIPELPSEQATPDIPKSGLGPTSEIPQERVEAVKTRDGFNWGYDPFHFMVPEGSYSSNPNGTARIREFREMVQGLNQSGLRVVMDVVFNHTHAAGQNASSVLDRIVPGYYHRLNAQGDVESSTCCANTATENRMMEKLMVDSLLVWAKAYKVDGFRFDLMGHHSLDNIRAVRKALDGLTLARDGVEGKSIYLYGEGWDFGEVAKNRLFVNASQLNLAGSRVGSFSDRFRDALRGGSPFTDLREQGLGNGLGTASSDYTRAQGAESIKERQAQLTELLECGLAANLKSYEIVNRQGQRVRCDALKYNGVAAGYSGRPAETVNYVAAHDNETLFDALQAKLPREIPIAARVRVNSLNLAFVALAQGVPFFHAGDEILRSKSMDRNSYDSGDWFNRLDFSYASNNWGVGLPPKGDNGKSWDLYRELLGNPALQVVQSDIIAARDGFLDFMRIRHSTPLFRLQSEAAVKGQVSFLNVGPARVPSLIVQEIRGGKAPGFQRVVVLFNAGPAPMAFSHEKLKGGKLRLHPVQASGHDAVVKTVAVDVQGSVTVPGWTAAVLVE